MVADALILVRAAAGMQDQLVEALAMQEDDTYTTYKIKGIDKVYKTSCGDHDAFVVVTAKDLNGIAKIETVIKSLSSKKGKAQLVSDTHVMPCVVKARGDP